MGYILNKEQFAKLSEDQKKGEALVKLSNEWGYVDGNRTWNPATGNEHMFDEKDYNSLTKDQKEGRSPVVINGKEGFMNGDSMWISIDVLNKK